MKKTPLNVGDVRNKIAELVGKNICMDVCRGRKKIFRYTGVVQNTFPSVFVVKLTAGETANSQLSYSYSDVVCGEVTVREAK
jgi:uncharacterized protein Veg